MRIIIVLLCTFLSLHSYAEKVIFLADEWCPYNCKPESSRPGFIVEILNQAFSKYKIEVIYKNEGWVRSIRLAKEGKANGIIGAYKEDAPEFIYPNEKMLVTRNLFFVNRSSNIKKISEEDIYKNTYSLGVIKGYFYNQKFNNYTNDRKNKVYQLHGVLPIQSMIKMLKLKRIDIALEEVNVWNHNVNSLGLKESEFRNVGTLLADDLYVAFSPSLPSSKRYAKILSNEIRRMRKSGVYDYYLKKYNLKYK